MYSPADVEQTTYPYLVSIYALLISALISLVKSNLTQNDAVFVLVAVASPVTLYLWVTFLFPTFFRRISQSWALAAETRISQRFFFIGVLGSLIMWLTMLGIIVGSPSDVSFSQKACSKVYGRAAFATMIWPYDSFSQILCIIIGLNFAVPGLPRCLGFAKNKTVLIHGALEPNLLQWTRKSLILVWPKMKKNQEIISSILFILQISLTAPFSNTGWYCLIAGSGIAGALLFFFLLDYGHGTYRHRQNRHHLPQHSMKEEPSINAKQLLFVLMAGILLGAFSIVSFIYSSMSIILVVVVLAPVWWVNAPMIYQSRRQVLWSRVFFIGSIAIPAVGQYSPLTILSIAILCWWIVPWAHATTVEPKLPYPFLERQRKLWYKFSNCGAFLKFGLFIINPTMSWVMAMIATGASLNSFSSALTFGQLLSIFTTILPIWTLISLGWKKKFDILAAVWMNEYQEDEIILPVILVTPPESLWLQVSENDKRSGPAMERTHYPTPVRDGQVEDF